MEEVSFEMGAERLSGRTVANCSKGSMGGVHACLGLPSCQASQLMTYALPVAKTASRGQQLQSVQCELDMSSFDSPPTYSY